MADVRFMKRARMILATLAALVLVAGCAYDDGTDLKPAVERATPEGASVLSACRRFRGPDRVALAQLYVLRAR